METELPKLVDMWFSNSENMFERNEEEDLGARKKQYIKLLTRVFQDENIAELQILLQKIHYPLFISEAEFGAAIDALRLSLQQMEVFEQEQ